MINISSRAPNNVNNQEPQHILDARVEAIKNDNLAHRTLILPIPDDCDSTGCPPKKWLRNNDDSEFENIPLEDIENNNDNSVQNSYYDVPLIKRLKSLVATGHKNTVVLNVPLKLRMDGPFGAPSSNIFQTEHAVLISTGIGVTPFTSILQSIMYRYTEQKKCCPNCSHTWSEKILSNQVMNLRKVDFVWINRDHSSFEWFVEKLEQLVQQELSVPGATLELTERFLDIHLYVTGTLTEALNCNSLNWTNGRPDWDSLFNKIRERNHGKVTVFYCGRPDLATLVRGYCNKFKFAFKKEVF